jgi:hypothetical protein
MLTMPLVENIPPSMDRSSSAALRRAIPYRRTSSTSNLNSSMSSKLR